MESHYFVLQFSGNSAEPQYTQICSAQNIEAEHVLQILLCLQNMICKLGSACRTCSAISTKYIYFKAEHVLHTLFVVTYTTDNAEHVLHTFF